MKDKTCKECDKVESKTITNGDRIRQMSDEELEKVIDCPYEECIHPHNDYEYPCVCCKLDWLNSPAEGATTGSAKCENCGRTYHKKKKAQRFCCIKCKDKWWNRNRSEDGEYLHPHCEDNFNGDW